MADFYTDHNVAVRVAQELTTRRHTARTARDLNLEAAGDEEHLWTAAANSWILVTHNRKDFELLHAAWALWTQGWSITHNHAGILCCPSTWPAAVIAQELANFLVGGYNLPGMMYTWRQQGGWRQVP